MIWARVGACAAAGAAAGAPVAREVRRDARPCLDARHEGGEAREVLKAAGQRGREEVQAQVRYAHVRQREVAREPQAAVLPQQSLEVAQVSGHEGLGELLARHLAPQRLVAEYRTGGWGRG